MEEGGGACGGQLFSPRGDVVGGKERTRKKVCPWSYARGLSNSLPPFLPSFLRNSQQGKRGRKEFRFLFLSHHGGVNTNLVVLPNQKNPKGICWCRRFMNIRHWCEEGKGEEAVGFFLPCQCWLTCVLWHPSSYWRDRVPGTEWLKKACNVV